MILIKDKFSLKKKSKIKFLNCFKNMNKKFKNTYRYFYNALLNAVL